MNYIVAEHNGVKINFNSFTSFCDGEQVENDMIDIVLKPLSDDFQIEPIHFCSVLFAKSTTPTELFDLSTNFALEKKKIIMPVFESNNFYLIVINLETREFLIYDSLPQPLAKFERKYKNFQIFVEGYNKRNAMSNNHIPITLRKVFNPPCYKQKTFIDCGIYLLIHAEQYMANEKIDITIPINIKDKRIEIQNQILKHSLNMQTKCLICGHDHCLYESSI